MLHLLHYCSGYKRALMHILSTTNFIAGYVTVLAPPPPPQKKKKMNK